MPQHLPEPPAGEYKEHGNYLVYRDGRIFSLITQALVGYSYGCNNYCYFCSADTWRRESVARLVATLWVSQPAGANRVRHKDRNSLNNHADNLEWFTIRPRQPTPNPRLGTEIIAWKGEQEVGRWPLARQAAAALGVHHTIISAVIKGRRRQGSGYTFTRVRITND